jgi:hypothetical protein
MASDRDNPRKWLFGPVLIFLAGAALALLGTRATSELPDVAAPSPREAPRLELEPSQIGAAEWVGRPEAEPAIAPPASPFGKLQARIPSPCSGAAAGAPAETAERPSISPG